MNIEGHNSVKLIILGGKIHERFKTITRSYDINDDI